MNAELETSITPDPSYGSVSKKNELLELATRHQILRISAENGITVEGALQAIKGYSEVIKASAFPESAYHLLK